MQSTCTLNLHYHILSQSIVNAKAQCGLVRDYTKSKMLRRNMDTTSDNSLKPFTKLADYNSMKLGYANPFSISVHIMKTYNLRKNRQF